MRSVPENDSWKCILFLGRLLLAGTLPFLLEPFDDGIVFVIDVGLHENLLKLPSGHVVLSTDPLTRLHG